MMMIGSPILVSLSVLPSAETGRRVQGTGRRAETLAIGTQVIENTMGEKRAMHFRKQAENGLYKDRFCFFGPFSSSFT
jgi:hypothetical protein